MKKKPNKLLTNSEIEIIQNLLSFEKAKNMKNKPKPKKRQNSFVATGIQCPDCKEIVISLHRHDFRSCGCKNKSTGVFIDGGRDYTRVGGHKLEQIKRFKVRISRDVVI